MRNFLISFSRFAFRNSQLVTPTCNLHFDLHTTQCIGSMLQSSLIGQKAQFLNQSLDHLTLKMTSAQVVETSVKVTPNSPSQDYTHPDDHNLRTYRSLTKTNRLACTGFSAFYLPVYSLSSDWSTVLIMFAVIG